MSHATDTYTCENCGVNCEYDLGDPILCPECEKGAEA